MTEADIQIYQSANGSQEIWLNGQPTKVDHIEIEQSYEEIRSLDHRLVRRIPLDPIVTLRLPVKNITIIKEESKSDPEEDRRARCY